MRPLFRPLALVLLVGFAACFAVARADTVMRPGTERPRPQPDEITVFITRHAEKDTRFRGPDTPLTAAGERRARELVRVLGESGVSVVFATPTRRATDTGAPMAAAIGDSVRIVPEVPGLIRRILRDHRGGRVLVIGHSNTVPEIIQALSGFRPPDQDEDEYDLLYVVTLSGSRPATVYSLRYGEGRAAR